LSTKIGLLITCTAKRHWANGSLYFCTADLFITRRGIGERRSETCEYRETARAAARLKLIN